MDIAEFRNTILEEVHFNSVVNRTSSHEEFLNLFSNALIDAEELNDFYFLPFEGIGPRNKKIQIDGYSYDDLDDCLNIVICIFEDGILPASLIMSEAEKYFGRARAFVEESMSGFILNNAEESSPGYGFAVDIKNRYKAVSKYKFYIMTDMIMSSKIKEIAATEVCGRPATYNIWDISRLQVIHESKTGKEDIIIDIKEFIPFGIPCLKASQTEDYTAYLCNIPGKLLADLYNKYGGRLLEGNVRSFLTVRGKVNKGIRNTILNDPAMFFAYNNGIAATAYNVDISEEQGSPHITEITALQIVNGGQTTASLAMALINDKDRANNLKNIYVPMKLSVVSPDKAIELIPNISRYANSQNKVSDADFFSNHTFHVRMEGFSRREMTPAVNGNQFGTYWYYERAKGQYNQEQAKLSQGDRTKFLLKNPKEQMFTKTDLAKYYNIYRMLPHHVSMGAQKNFIKFAEWTSSEWDKNEAQFNVEFFKKAVALTIMFKQTDKLVKAQSWYELGYKAQVITYTLSKLFHTIETMYPDKAFDFRTIWNKQEISGTIQKQLVEIAQIMYNHLTGEKREVQNVTEWAKRESCWRKAQDITIKLREDFVASLVEKYTERQANTDARREQRAVNKVNAMVEVADYGIENFKKLRRWGESTKVLTPIELSFIDSAIAMEQGKFPSEKQSIRIIEILYRAREESYPG